MLSCTMSCPCNFSSQRLAASLDSALETSLTASAFEKIGFDTAKKEPQKVPSSRSALFAEPNRAEYSVDKADYQLFPSPEIRRHNVETEGVAQLKAT